ncbi:MAG: hypothetical protein EU531_05235 [Promethearchaeota archaeon]|nr:MAG: hypothetical protein EU531_05235 [Candidatus Lokiarchaeota archaeon]
MCNNCDCENYERCSIVGYLPYGVCCPNCVKYDEVHTCKYYQPRFRAPYIDEDEVFQLKSKEEKTRILTASIKHFP